MVTVSSFSQKIIVITGAANGICRQAALDLDEKKYILCLFDKDEKLNEIKGHIKNATLLIKVGDVRKEEEVNLFINTIISKFGEIDVLINGAAVIPYIPLTETPYSLFKETLEVNLGGYFLFSKGVSESMKRKRSGVIINISSISAIIGIPGQAAYASSKGGIAALTRVLATELGAYGIRVNAIAPGSVIVNRNKISMSEKWSDDNNLRKRIPLARLGNPSDVSGIIQFLISDWSSYVHGTVIVVDGGMTIRGA